MPAGNFDEQLTIDEHGSVSPAGPLQLAADETAVRLDAWVFQPGGACVAVQRDFPDRTRWATTPNPAQDHAGAKFQPGTATGTALLVSRTADGQTITFRWTDQVELVAK